MALNFLGLGFSFGSQDKGLSKSLQTTSSGLADIGKSVVEISTASAKMAFKPPNFGPMIGQVSALATDVKVTTTQLEAFGVQASKTASAGMAGLNLTAKQFKEAKSLISSTAFAMNTDVGAVTKSFVALKQSNVDMVKFFKSAGLKGFKDYQKFIEVTGADATEFAGMIGRLTNQMGFSNKQAAELANRTIALGKKFNIGREAASGMAETVKMLNENSNLLPKTWGPARTKKFVEGTVAFAGALTKAGLTAEEAMKASQGFTKALLQNEKGMTRLYTGLEKELPQVSTAMTKHLGNATDAFAMLQNDPASFMKNMGGMVDEINSMNLSDAELAMFRAEMEKTFGPDIMAAFTKKGFGKIGPALDEAQKAIPNQADTMKNLSKRYEDGRTAAERFAIAQDRLVTRMKKVHGVMSDQTFLKKYRKNTDDLANRLNDMAKKGGPVGKMTQKLIEFRTFGIGGTVASMHPMGLMFTELATQFGPILKVLPGLAAAFAALASPIALVAAAVGGLFFVFKDLEKGDKSIVRPWIAKLKKEAPKILEAVKNAFTKALSIIGKVISYVVEKIDFNEVGRVLGRIFEKALEVSLVIFKAAFKLGEKLLIWLGELDWGAIGQKIGYYLAAAFAIALEAVAKVVKNLPQILIKAVSKAVDAIIGLLSGIEDYLVKRFPKAAGPIKVIFAVLKAIVHTIGVVLKAAIKVVVGAFKLLWKVAGTIIKAIKWGFDKIVGAVKAVGKGISWVAGKVGGAVSAVGGFFSSIGSGIKSIFSSGGTSRLISDRMKQIVESQKTAAQLAEEHRKRIQEKMDKAAAAAITNIDQITDKTSAGVKKAFDDLIKSGKKVVTVEGVVIDSSKAITQYVHDATGKVKKMVYEANQLRLADIDLDPFKDARKEYWKLKQEGKDLLKNENYNSEKYDEYWQRRMSAVKAFKEQYGVSMGAVAYADKYIREQMGLNKALFDNSTEASESYRRALIANQNQLAKNAGEQFLIIQKALEAGKITREEANKQFKAVEKQVSASREMAAEVIPIIKGNFDELMSGLKVGSTEASVQAARIAKVYTQNWRGQVDEILNKIPESSKMARDEIARTYDDLTKTYEAQLKSILTNTELSDQARKKQLDNLNEQFEKAQKDLTKTIGEQNKALVVGATDDTLAAVKKIKEGFKVMTDETKIKTAEAAGEIQKTMGVSADEASRMVGTISNLKPRKFKKNMAIIKGEFKDFLKAVTDESKTMMDKGAKYVNTFWETSKKGWEMQTQLISKWADDSKGHINRYWTAVLTEAGKAAVGFVQFTEKIIAALKVMGKSINVMDLLASPSQIWRWAQSVSAALAYSFKTGGAVDALISKSYITALKSAAAVATPDEMEGGQAKSGHTSFAAASLIDAINYPMWARKNGAVVGELQEMNENLRDLKAAMGKAMTGQPSEAPTAKRRKARLRGT